MSLEATDLEVWGRCTWQEDAGEPVDLLLPSVSVGGLLKETSDETVEIEERDKGIEFKTRDTRARLPKVPSVEFPAWPEVDRDGGEFQTTAGRVARALRLVGFAAAQEKSRYALNGVLVALAGKAVEWVATDGRRLSWVREHLGGDGHASGEGKAILGLKMVSLLERAFVSSEEPLQVSFSRRLARVAGPSLEVLGRLVEGSYPDYRAVLPKNLPERVVVEARELERAIRKAVLVTSAASGSVGWRLSEGALEVTGQSAEEGEVRCQMAAQYTGSGLQIRFNPRFLLDALRVVADGQVEIELKDPSSPGLVHLGEDALYVVLPVHLVS